MSTASFALTNQSNIDVNKGSGLAGPLIFSMSLRKLNENNMISLKERKAR